MKLYWPVLALLCLFLAACGHDDQAKVTQKTETQALAADIYERMGNVQNVEKPPMEQLQHIKLTLDVSNFDELDRLEIVVDENVRTLFGNDYWYGSYKMENGHYEYEMIVDASLSEKQIKEKLKQMHYTVIWYNGHDKQKKNGHFGH